MIYQFLLNLDHNIFKAINQFALKWTWLDLVGIFLANYFPYIVAVALFLFLLRWKKPFGRFRASWQMVLAALVAAGVARFGIVEVIRWFKPRLRPFNVPDINLLISKVNESSFPSGHASFFFALATVVFLNNKKAGIWFYAAAVLISIARVFVGVHWPSDILAGAILGILMGWILNWLFRKHANKIIKNYNN